MEGNLSNYVKNRSLWLERVAIIAMLLAALSLSLIRVDATDTPWHLATARLAFDTGHWPTKNTFSYTFPDYKLYQQYPLYQALLYEIYLKVGWDGLSLLNCLGWMGIFCLWILWGGNWRWAALLSLLWMLGLLGLQRRMILRPELLTMFFFICQLHLIDLYRRGRTWVAGLFVLNQLLLANSHQLFPLGLAAQICLLVHLVLVRAWGGHWGIDAGDRKVPILPVILALAGSVLACAATPLGADIFAGVTHTAGSLFYHRDEVMEFAPFYTSTYDTILIAMAFCFSAIAFWKDRRKWCPYEAGLWALGAGLVVMAIRGTSFFVILSIAIVSRILVRSLTSPLSIKWNRSRRLLAAMVIVSCISLIRIRWISPVQTLGRIQTGIGRTSGDWPDKAIEFIRTSPPPGRMMNLSWYSGNVLIWGLYPEHRVFVDPRFETYPRNFLLAAINSYTDGIQMGSLIDQYHPDWIVAELRVQEVRKRAAALIKSRLWSLVYADTIFMVLVRESPGNAEYLAAHRIIPEDISPNDLLIRQPDLLALQYVRLAMLYRDLGVEEKSAHMIEMAEPSQVKYPAVRQALQEWKKYQ
jgi:hypothetical protein